MHWNVTLNVLPGSAILYVLRITGLTTEGNEHSKRCVPILSTVQQQKPTININYVAELTGYVLYRSRPPQAQCM